MSRRLAFALNPARNLTHFIVSAIFTLTCLPGISLGQATDSNPKNASENQIGPKFEKVNGIKDGGTSLERFHDWHMRCVPNDHSPGICEIAQVAQVMREQGGDTVLSMAIAPNMAASQSRDGIASPSMSLTMLVPLNVALPAGLSISADGKPITRLAYRNCNQSGCWAVTSLRPAMLSALKKGRTGAATLNLVDGQALEIQFSLTGFTAALAALESQTQIRGGAAP